MKVSNIMELEKITKDLKETLSAKRFHHSEGVAYTGRYLANKYGADPKKAFIAGWIHDCAKELSLSDMKSIVQEAGLKLDKQILSSRALLHGPAGSVLAKTRFGIDDAAICSAICYHTTGNVNMTLLEKIIFLADYIEPSRDFPGVNKLRSLAEQDLDLAVLAAYDSTITHLIDQKAYIYDLTFKGRNHLVLQCKEKINEAEKN